jgi:hypothetical protein
VNDSSSTTEVNRPDVVAEVTKVFEDYEGALVANDVDAMIEAFWDSELTVRYGVREASYGVAEIAEWRRAAMPLPPDRRIGPTVIVTFGDSFATISTEFRNGAGPRTGRQSQTWVRRPEGWRIVAAHVSLQLTT